MNNYPKFTEEVIKLLHGEQLAILLIPSKMQMVKGLTVGMTEYNLYGYYTAIGKTTYQVTDVYNLSEKVKISYDMSRHFLQKLNEPLAYIITDLFIVNKDKHNIAYFRDMIEKESHRYKIDPVGIIIFPLSREQERYSLIV